MPQIQFLPEAPGFGTELGRALGSGLGQGISAGLTESLKQFKEQKLKLEKNLGKVGSTFDFYRKNFGYKDLPESDLESIYKNARSLVEKGYSTDEAVENAFNAYKAKSLEGTERKETGSAALKALKIPPRPSPSGFIESAMELGKKAGKGAETFFQPQPERAPGVPRENIQELLAQADQQGPRVFNKFLSTLSREEFLSLPREQQIALSKQLGSEIIPQEVERTIARGIVGHKGAERIAQGAGLPDVEFGTPQAQATGELYGKILRDLGLFKTAGMAPNLPARAAAAAGLFGTTAASEQLLAGEKPTLEHVGKEVLIGAATEIAPELIGKLFRFLKTKIPIKGGKGPAPSTAAEGIKEIEFKPGKTEFKAGEVPRSPSPGPQTAEEAKEVYNNIVNDAVKNLEGRGITLDQINSGDPAAVKALQEEANKAANLYKEADKINLKEFEKQRQDIIKKTAESPLEKYYEPKKEVVSRPETIAKNLERIKPLETSIKQNERRVRDLQYQILSADEAIREGRLSPLELERVRATREANALAHARAMNEIQNAKFEIKYGRSPMSLEDISKQIETTFNELREGIKNPEAKKVEVFRKGFERDKHMIDDALKLAERGQLPGPEVFDEYIKINNEYLKSYETLIDELSSFIKEHKGKTRWGNKVTNAESLLEVVKNQRKLSEAKIKLQEDKRKALNLLEKPSGAFIKNSLRDLRKDVDAFQKDFFTWNKLASGTEAKAAQVAKEKIKPFPKVEEKVFQRKTLEPKEPPKVQKKHAKGEAGRSKETAEAAASAAKNPNSENLKTAAERAGMTKEEYKEYLDKISKKASELKSKIKTGEATPHDEIGLLKQILTGYTKLKKLPKAIVNGVVIGTTQGIIEETFGKKVPSGYLSLGATLLPGKVGSRVGGAAIAGTISHYIKEAFNEAAANQLRSLRSRPDEYNAYYRKLKQKYGDSRAAKIRKEALS